jgi:hypothetical protein
MPEHRTAGRHRMFKAAKMLFNNGGSVLDCTMRNVSETGACLAVANGLAAPAKFDLLHDGDRSPCEVVWRQVGRIGVRFLNVTSCATDQGAQARASCTCPRCQLDMSLIQSLPAAGDLPEVQAFRCDHCGETLVRESEAA